ncbi:collagen-like protein [uncultured Maribacter sp.]|uniref:collagen-like protein n=1 Tax=uncultured Maribacter sp. TaxID=431308 RepID=UPI0030EE6E34|tara:strand:- start:58676 stop:59239 length:564 start_codon:yes stop_codon:yes gene_type:complete
MKKLNLFLGALVTILFISCEGPQGPSGFDGFDGIDGEDGEDGVNILGQVMDIEGTFTLENDFAIFYEFPQSVEVFETDVVLVYLLWDETEDGNGDLVDIWRLMPQTRILDQGLLQYNFDYTFFDVNIFLESDFDLSTLPAGDTENQVFRIAVLPAESTTGKLDTSDINSVMAHLGVSEENVQKIKLD